MVTKYGVHCVPIAPRESLLTALCTVIRKSVPNPACCEPPPQCSSLKHFSSLLMTPLPQMSLARPLKVHLAWLLSVSLASCHITLPLSFLSCRILILLQFLPRTMFLPATALLHVSFPLTWTTPGSYSPSDPSLIGTSLGMLSLTTQTRSDYTGYAHSSLLHGMYLRYLSCNFIFIGLLFD